MLPGLYTGSSLHAIDALFEKDHEVIALDTDEARVDKMGPDVTRAVVGDARDHEVLERIGAADAGVVSTGEDMRPVSWRSSACRI